MMLAYRAHPKVTKDWFVDEMLWHQVADHLVKGRYGRREYGGHEFRGCAVGCGIYSVVRRSGLSRAAACTINFGDHVLLADALGIPPELIEAQDVLFERMHWRLTRQWPVAFARAIPEGGDLRLVWQKLERIVQDWLAEPNTGRFPNARRLMFDFAATALRDSCGEPELRTYHRLAMTLLALMAAAPTVHVVPAFRLEEGRRRDLPVLADAAA